MVKGELDVILDGDSVMWKPQFYNFTDDIISKLRWIIHHIVRSYILILPLLNYIGISQSTDHIAEI